MRVLVIGATGLIGEALVGRLAKRGHDVVLGVRNIGAAKKRWPAAEFVHVDYAELAATGQSAVGLHGIDAVVNAVGIFREQGSQTFDALHVKGPLALFEAAAQAGVRRIVQISALGAHPYTDTGYLASKGRADAALCKSRVPHTIVQPSLVFAPQGRSTRWFALLAALPLTPLPGGGRQRIQPVHLDDLCEAIVRLLDMPDAPLRLEAVGGEPVTLRGYLGYFKQALRLPGGFVSVPMAWVRMMSRLLAFMPGSLATPESLRMLEAGSIGQCRAFATVLGRAPTPLEGFIGEHERTSMRRRAQLDWLLPLLRYAMALMWVATGLVSLFAFPVQSSLELLARTGLHGALAMTVLQGAALLDIVLGAALFWRPLRRWAYRAQFILIAFYTAVITVFLPEYWRHPYGPVLKNLPLLAAIALLHELDDDNGPADR
ncbi:uncharacterized protein YbjT (DUF2867 family) [Luteimonas cucumeris]|uniref:Uncharacterized protein YbjT (DUF2867 family) n=1 Tax=Luteimonas cucumeris TaxID=985012 RepID=A0A562L2M5_9GAMM|nr:SDR family oxidoreductase [Luteimonas cucumeris]TWI01714.1 uncharacterized protein YbjT (DUF2867 family) [Luteimonas cucumeris]